MDIPEPIYNLTLLFDMWIHNTSPRLRNYIIEHVEEPKTNKEQQQYETIVIRETTLNIKKQSLSLEMALFPFLIPHGHGSYDGIISFNEYLK